MGKGGRWCGRPGDRVRPTPGDTGGSGSQGHRPGASVTKATRKGRRCPCTDCPSLNHPTVDSHPGAPARCASPPPPPPFPSPLHSPNPAIPSPPPSPPPPHPAGCPNPRETSLHASWSWKVCFQEWEPVGQAASHCVVSGGEGTGRDSGRPRARLERGSERHVWADGSCDPAWLRGKGRPVYWRASGRASRRREHWSWRGGAPSRKHSGRELWPRGQGSFLGVPALRLLGGAPALPPAFAPPAGGRHLASGKPPAAWFQGERRAPAWFDGP